MFEEELRLDKLEKLKKELLKTLEEMERLNKKSNKLKDEIQLEESSNIRKKMEQSKLSYEDLMKLLSSKSNV